MSLKQKEETKGEQGPTSGENRDNAKNTRELKKKNQNPNNILREILKDTVAINQFAVYKKGSESKELQKFLKKIIQTKCNKRVSSISKYNQMKEKRDKINLAGPKVYKQGVPEREKHKRKKN